MIRWLRMLSPRDARGMSLGVLIVLLAGTIVVERTDPDTRLFRFLRHLPPSVLAVVIEPGPRESRQRGTSGWEPGPRESRQRGTSGWKPDQPIPSVARLPEFLGFPHSSIPGEVRPRATLLVDRGDGKQETIVLLERSRAAAAGLRGPSLAGFTALAYPDGSRSDPPSDPARVVADLWRSAEQAHAVPTTLFRFLSSSSGTGMRLLLRPRVIADRLPSSFRTILAADFLAITVHSDGSHVSVRGLLPGKFSTVGRGANLLLKRSLPAALLVLDGVPASELLPADLPPILAALKAESGVQEELDALFTILGSNPTATVVLPGSKETADVIVGVSLLGVSAQDARTAARGLLRKRQELKRAVVEQIRADGRVIRHRRLARQDSSGGASDAVPALLETSRDGWNILRSPHGTGSTDLVLASNGSFLLLGTSEEGVLAVGSVLGDETGFPRVAGEHARVGTEFSGLRLTADIQGLRGVSIVRLALRGLSEGAPPWLSSLQSLAFDVDATADALHFHGSAVFEPSL